MSYALVIDGQIQRTTRLPRAAKRLDTGEEVDLSDADQATREACGWYEIVKTQRPVDTEAVVHGGSVELVEGVPTLVWPARARTPAERAEWRNSDRGDSGLRTQVANEVAANEAFLDDQNLTNAELVKQVRALTRQNNALIRLLLHGRG